MSPAQAWALTHPCSRITSLLLSFRVTSGGSISRYPYFRCLRQSLFSHTILVTILCHGSTSCAPQKVTIGLEYHVLAYFTGVLGTVIHHASSTKNSQFWILGHDVVCISRVALPVRLLWDYISFGHPRVGMMVSKCIRAVFRGCLLSSISFSISRVFCSTHAIARLWFYSVFKSLISGMIFRCLYESTLSRLFGSVGRFIDI